VARIQKPTVANQQCQLNTQLSTLVKCHECIMMIECCLDICSESYKILPSIYLFYKHEMVDDAIAELFANVF
jgi:hypothetical protein